MKRTKFKITKKELTEVIEKNPVLDFVPSNYRNSAVISLVKSITEKAEKFQEEV